MTDVILVVVIVAFFAAMALLVPALSRVVADSTATGEDAVDLGPDGGEPAAQAARGSGAGRS